MINHPHDCPVCDEGGECHLQDMTVMTRHTYRRYRFRKNTHRNQELGPFIHHEMNRCIACYRCVRFYRDYAGGRDLNVFGIHNRLYFGRFDNGTLENEFSGNLVEVCPTGVFTDKTFRKHFTRKWDLQTAPSVCVHCGVGCNTLPGERYGTLRRIRNRYNGEVNGYFLCDRGRFGYDFVNTDHRIRTAFRGDGSGGMTEISPNDGVEILGGMLDQSQGLIGIGSPRASLESNYALWKLVGPERFYSGLSGKELSLVRAVLEIVRSAPAPSPSLRQVEASDAILILGEDLTNTAPRMALSLRQSVLIQPVQAAEKLGIERWNDRPLRQAIRNDHGPLFNVAATVTRLADVATENIQAAPDDIARLGFAVARELDESAPDVDDLTGGMRETARNIAAALKTAEAPLIISGIGSGQQSVMHAAANVAAALRRMGRDASLALIVPECNSFGVGLMDGGPLEAAMAEINEGRADTIVIVENDLYRRMPRGVVDEFLARAKNTIVIDHIFSGTSSNARLIMPAATFAEGEGSLVSSEGRCQRFFKVVDNPGEIRESWRWLGDLMMNTGRADSRAFDCLDSVTRAMSEELPVFKRVPEVAPDADFRAVGQKIPRQSHRYSGRTAMHANVDVHEPKPPGDPDSALAFSMEGFRGMPPSSLIPRFWAPGWNSVQAINKFQSEINGPLVGGDPGLRLIEGDDAVEFAYFTSVPNAFHPRKDEWLVVPAYHIFGSEELSALSPPIRERVQGPYIGLNPEDSQSLELVDGQECELVILNNSVKLPVKLISSVPKGVAVLPIGLEGLETMSLPALGRIVAGDSGHEGSD
ncbi:MAG: NADH-quinone oxidoreductase subunit NuoG, partial [Deltaproteobacteria bacterium]